MASIASGLGSLKRWLYRGGRPHLLARAMNRLSAQLHAAPGARPHLPVDKHASLEQFAAIAAQFPVFRVTRVD